MDGCRCYIPASKIHQWHSKYDVFPSQERSKKCGGTSPNSIGLLGKDERRSVLRGRGSKGGNKHEKVHRPQPEEQPPQFPGSINYQIKQCRECKRRPVDRTNPKMRSKFSCERRCKDPKDPAPGPWRQAREGLTKSRSERG
jgi:hypothetical protein